jgi:hypothetical protein
MQMRVDRDVTVRRADDSYSIVTISVAHGLTAFTVVKDKEIAKYRDPPPRYPVPVRNAGERDARRDQQAHEHAVAPGAAKATPDSAVLARESADDSVSAVFIGVKVAQAGFEAADVPCCLQVCGPNARLCIYVYMCVCVSVLMCMNRRIGVSVYECASVTNAPNSQHPRAQQRCEHVYTSIFVHAHTCCK